MIYRSALYLQENNYTISLKLIRSQQWSKNFGNSSGTKDDENVSDFAPKMKKGVKKRNVFNTFAFLYFLIAF